MMKKPTFEKAGKIYKRVGKEFDALINSKKPTTMPYEMAAKIRQTFKDRKESDLALIILGYKLGIFAAKRNNDVRIMAKKLTDDLRNTLKGLFKNEGGLRL